MAGNSVKKLSKKIDGSVDVNTNTLNGIKNAASNSGIKTTNKSAPLTTEQLLSKYESNVPKSYQSNYQSQIDATLDSILNREKFSYDMNGDPLYQQYKNQYTKLGNMAMQDTMGNAAALTGGYGNSYATTAGSQAYQSYLDQLNNIVPELEARAYDRYNQDGNDLLNRLSIYQGLDQNDYGRYRDTISDYYNNLNYYYGKYADELQQKNWQDQFDYQKAYDTQQQNNWQSQFDYQKAYDEQQQKNWQTQWDYQVQQNALKGSGGGGGGGNYNYRRSSDNDKSTYNRDDYIAGYLAETQDPDKKRATRIDHENWMDANLSSDNAKYAYVNEQLNNSNITPEDAILLRNYIKTGRDLGAESTYYP